MLGAMAVELPNTCAASILLPADLEIAKLAGVGVEAALVKDVNSSRGSANQSSHTSHPPQVDPFGQRRRYEKPGVPQYAIQGTGSGGAMSGSPSGSSLPVPSAAGLLSSNAMVVENEGLTSFVRDRRSLHLPIPPPYDMLRPPQS